MKPFLCSASSALLGVIFGCGVLTTSAIARGDGPPSSTDARALFDEGTALVNEAKGNGDRSKYEIAIPKFLASYALEPSSTTLFSLALAESKAGHDAASLHHFRGFLRDLTADATWREKAVRYVDQLSHTVASFDVVAPAGSDIAIDGHSTGETAPLSDPLDLAPGPHTIEARLSGRSATNRVDAVAGTRTNLTFNLEPTSDTTTPVQAPLAPSPIGVTGGGPAPQQPRSAARTVSLAITGGGALVAAGFGVGFLIAMSDAGDREQAALGGGPSYHCVGLTIPSCQSAHQAADDKVNDATNAAIAFTSAGVLAIGFAAVWAFWPSTREAASTSVRVAPSVGASHGGLTVFGQF